MILSPADMPDDMLEDAVTKAKEALAENMTETDGVKGFKGAKVYNSLIYIYSFVLFVYLCIHYSLCKTNSD
jgi:hypothetical protein